jgi:hypothetical protein
VPSDEQPTAKQTSVTLRSHNPAVPSRARCAAPSGNLRRLAVGEPKLAAEVPGRHVRAAGERLDVQRLRELPIDPVAKTRRSRARSRRCCAAAGLLVTCEIVLRRAGGTLRRWRQTPLLVRSGPVCSLASSTCSGPAVSATRPTSTRLVSGQLRCGSQVVDGDCANLARCHVQLNSARLRGLGSSR